MDDVYNNPEFQSIHTLTRRVGRTRHDEEHPYQSVITGLRSRPATPRPRRRLLALRRHALRSAQP